MYISQNPYRTIGVVSNSGAKEVQKNLSKLKAYAKIGRNPAFAYDLSFLNLAEIDRSENVINKVENKITLDRDKVKYALFWFLDQNPVDSVALKSLTSGDITKAIDIWVKTTSGKKISNKNYSAFNNLSSLLILKSLDVSKSDCFAKREQAHEDLRLAINLKNELLNSEFFSSFCECVSKSEKSIDFDEMRSFFNDEIISILNKNHNTSELAKLFKGLDSDLGENLNNSLVDEPISEIHKAITFSSESLEKNHAKGMTIGKQLIKDTFKPLKQVKDLMGKDDYQYQTIADRLSNQIMQCGVLCYNKTENDLDFLSSYKYALTIATEAKTIKRANDCIKHCEEEKDSNTCKFCNLNSVSSNSSFRVKLHKMSFDGSYNYFKNGGVEVSCCKNCSKNIRLRKYGSPILGFAIYGVIVLLSGGILIGIDVIFFRLMLFKGINKFIRKLIFYNNVKHHPTLKSLDLEGYKYGMPNQQTF